MWLPIGYVSKLKGVKFPKCEKCSHILKYHDSTEIESQLSCRVCKNIKLQCIIKIEVEGGRA